MGETDVGLVARNRHLMRLDHELCAHVLGHRPADYTEADAVEHDRQIDLTAQVETSVGSATTADPGRPAVRVARDRLQRAHHHQPRRPGGPRETLVANTQQGIDIVPVAAVEQAAVNGGVPPDQAGAVAADYGTAQLDALRLSLGAVALTALLSLWLTRRLPTTSLAETEVGATEATAVT